MTGMTLWQPIVPIAMVVLGTMITRFAMFFIFSAGRPTPGYIRYLGKVLPAAALGLLVMYCFRNESLFVGNRAIPELVAALVVAGLHFWRRNMLLSMAGGTIFYIVLLRYITI